MIYLVILRQNHSINHKLNATSIVLWAGTTPGASRARGPVGHCTSGRLLNPPLYMMYNIHRAGPDIKKILKTLKN